jgi:uncharacterized membrane protein YhhN
MATISIGGARFSCVVTALLTLSLVAGLSLPMLGAADGGAGVVIIKGLAVGLLALAALALPMARRGWLAAIMAAGALGDVLLELPGLFLVGAAAFAIGHGIGIIFYWRNLAAANGAIERVAALGLIGWGLAMPGLISPPGTPVGALMLYSVLLCGMAAALLLSRFSRVAVAGALLFVASDTLLIMRLGGRQIGGDVLHGALVWYAYYAAQLLIFVGIATGLKARRAR